jgi:hypothetical protein
MRKALLVLSGILCPLPFAASQITNSAIARITNMTLIMFSKSFNVLLLILSEFCSAVYTLLRQRNPHLHTGPGIGNRSAGGDIRRYPALIEEQFYIDPAV